MTPDIVNTDSGLDAFVSFLTDRIGAAVTDGRIVRDVFGRLSFIAPPRLNKEDVNALLQGLPDPIRPFLSSISPILHSGSGIAASIVQEPNLLMKSHSGSEFRLIDRRIAGEAWLESPSTVLASPPRIAFYGLKGGVGRSTALAVCAADTASRGGNILVIDLDLEAPGLASILLSPDRVPEYGVLDWLSSATLGLDPSVLLPDMLGGSPFTTGGGVVDVVPAAGALTLSHPETYLSKLARSYVPGAPTGRFMKLSFTAKIEILIEELMTYRRYDAIFIDVRAGLHETSASSLLGLGATSLLFGTSTTTTKDGYSILLATVRQAMESWPTSPELRDRFKMVHGRASQNTGRSEFRTACWQLWLDHLYDISGDEVDPTIYSFDLDDPSGPHFPLTVLTNEAFNDFDPSKTPAIYSENSYSPAFGDLVHFVRGLVPLELAQ